MKKITTVAVVLLAAATLAACSSPAAAPAPTSAPPAATKTPTPDAEQAKALHAKLGSINPAFDQDKVADKSKYICRYILDKAEPATITKAAKTHFGSSSVTITDAQATTIVDAVSANGFCK